jgi:hypothetical protein
LPCRNVRIAATPAGEGTNIPRSGSGTYSFPAGSVAVPNTPISSVAHNAILTDLQADLNAARPVSAGGTGATSPASAFEALSPMTARGDLVTRGATVSQRLAIGAAGTVLGSDGTDAAWKTGANIWSDIAQPATETAAGTLEVATEAENAARTSAALAVTPKYNPLPPGFIFGCGISNAASDPVNDIGITPGKVRDDADGVNIILAAALTKRLDSNWAVGNDQGGLDAGSVANGTYHVWLIKRSDTDVVDALFSASVTAPSMPSGYVFKRRIGSILREAASNVAFRQSGDRFWRSSPTSDLNATNPGTAAVTRTLKVPLGIQVDAMVIHVAIERTSNQNYWGLLSSLNDTNVTPSTAAHDVGILTEGSDQAALSSVSREITTNTLGQIRSRVSDSNATTVERILTFGWIDTRDRF